MAVGLELMKVQNLFFFLVFHDGDLGLIKRCGPAPKLNQMYLGWVPLRGFNVSFDKTPALSTALTQVHTQGPPNSL